MGWAVPIIVVIIAVGVSLGGGVVLVIVSLGVLWMLSVVAIMGGTHLMAVIVAEHLAIVTAGGTTVGVISGVISGRNSPEGWPLLLQSKYRTSKRLKCCDYKSQHFNLFKVSFHPSLSTTMTTTSNNLPCNANVADAI